MDFNKNSHGHCTHGYRWSCVANKTKKLCTCLFVVANSMWIVGLSYSDTVRGALSHTARASQGVMEATQMDFLSQVDNEGCRLFSTC